MWQRPADGADQALAAFRARFSGPALLVLISEHFNVDWAFFQRGSGAALHLYADLLDDVRISERGDVAGIHLIGNGGKHAAHDFAGAGLGHIRDDVDGFWARDLADDGFDR